MQSGKARAQLTERDLPGDLLSPKQFYTRRLLTSAEKKSSTITTELPPGQQRWHHGCEGQEIWEGKEERWSPKLICDDVFTKLPVNEHQSNLRVGEGGARC